VAFIKKVWFRYIDSFQVQFIEKSLTFQRDVLKSTSHVHGHILFNFVFIYYHTWRSGAASASGPVDASSNPEGVWGFVWKTSQCYCVILTKCALFVWWKVKWRNWYNNISKINIIIVFLNKWMIGSEWKYFISKQTIFYLIQVEGGKFRFLSIFFLHALNVILSAKIKNAFYQILQK
jgi:hypothetical protein